MRALQEAREGFGKEDAHVASAENNLAELYRVMHQFDKAELLYMEVRLTSSRIRCSHTTQTHHWSNTCLLWSSAHIPCLQGEKRSSQLIRVHAQALQKLLKAFGPDDLRVAQAYSNAASCFAGQNSLEQARTYSEKALQVH